MKKISNCIKTWPPKPTSPASSSTQFCASNNACELRLISENTRLTWEIKGNTPHSVYLSWFVGRNFFLSSEVIALRAKNQKRQCSFKILWVIYKTFLTYQNCSMEWNTGSMRGNAVFRFRLNSTTFRWLKFIPEMHLVCEVILYVYYL